MGTVRTFKLINSTGAEWDLMRKDAFLYEPDGLGFDKENEYMRIGSTYDMVQEIPSQKAVSFTMVFKNYVVFREFSNFITYTPLKLAYKPYPTSDWAYLDGMFTSVGKGEIDHDRKRLLCGCTFTGHSLWYIVKPARRTSDDVESPKKYSYTYGYTYADELNGFIRITNESSDNSPGKITIMGPVTDPAWFVTVNNVTIASGSIAADIPDGDKVVINSKDGSLEVSEYSVADNVLVRNLYQLTDFSKETFVTFPPGNSVLFITSSSPQSINAWVEVEEVHDTL